MPIYEFACPKCRVVFSFLSKRLNPDKNPSCPKCGCEDLQKQVTGFAISRPSGEVLERTPGNGSEMEGSGEDFPMPNLEDPKVRRAMREMERQMPHLDENNPRHMAHLMRKMKELMPNGTVPADMERAIRRLEAGEDLETVEADMGDVLETGGMESDETTGDGISGYSRDSGLYEY